MVAHRGATRGEMGIMLLLSLFLSPFFFLSLNVNKFMWLSNAWKKEFIEIKGVKGGMDFDNVMLQ